MILGLLMHMVKVDREKKGMLAYEKEVTRLMTPSKSAHTYLYNAGPHAHGARGEEGRVRGEGHISSTAGYFRGARLGHL